jgi:hypothetical protein
MSSFIYTYIPHQDANKDSGDKTLRIIDVTAR